MVVLVVTIYLVVMNILQLKRIIELIYVHSLDLIIKKAD